jgi:hypothetical protein
MALLALDFVIRGGELKQVFNLKPGCAGSEAQSGVAVCFGPCESGDRMLAIISRGLRARKQIGSGQRRTEDDHSGGRKAQPNHRLRINHIKSKQNLMGA